jgi:hypothetical protein
MALAPLAVQAGTRAASSPVAVDGQRGAGPLAEQRELRRPLLWILLLLAALTAVHDASGGRSRG